MYDYQSMYSVSTWYEQVESLHIEKRNLLLRPAGEVQLMFLLEMKLIMRRNDNYVWKYVCGWNESGEEGTKHIMLHHYYHPTHADAGNLINHFDIEL